MARCFEQEKSNGGPLKKIHNCVKTDSPIPIDADFECLNMTKDDPDQKTLFVSNPKAKVLSRFDK